MIQRCRSWSGGSTAEECQCGSHQLAKE